MAGSKKINITFDPGFYIFDILAESIDDPNILDSITREVEVVCDEID